MPSIKPPIEPIKDKPYVFVKFLIDNGYTVILSNSEDPDTYGWYQASVNRRLDGIPIAKLDKDTHCYVTELSKFTIVAKEWTQLAEEIDRFVLKKY